MGIRDRKECFLRALEQTANVSEAARSSGLSRRAAYRLRKEDPEFSQAWDRALARPPAGKAEPERWGAQVLALMDEGVSYREAVDAVAERAIAEARQQADAIRAFVEEVASNDL